ncbi:transketolase [Kibdelosporangium phytohabitans]|uniref:Transketolase n=2 Tax=Kibdelosporangium phytohabitans TaxID=860235 RepID=A0A0N9IHI5_9PSEU|nr:transketolase C-terminal domain-containing protein [Kibdelosporangium phytohabitans]ALG14945.1 transketolase [Kibdelosporangium phytohabitans]
MRVVFAQALTKALVQDSRLAVVTADISSAAFGEVRERFPDRVVNVGIREQAMIGVAGGLALSGLRPVVHSYAPFLVERPYEQIKLDFGHQDVGAVLVSIGGSYDDPVWGRTHQSPADVTLIDSLPGWTVHVPGHPAEVEPLLAEALAGDDRVYLRLSTRTNSTPFGPSEGFTVVRTGARAVVLAVGPILDQVLAAMSDVDVTVLYASTIRPFDHAGLRAAVQSAAPDVVLVEPYLRGTSAHEVAVALADVPHRQLALGVDRAEEKRVYGTAPDHDRLHGLDPAGIARAVNAFLGAAR